MEKFLNESVIAIPNQYNMNAKELIILYDNSDGVFELISKAFKIGFSRGMRCQKNAAKKGKVKK